MLRLMVIRAASSVGSPCARGTGVQRVRRLTFVAAAVVVTLLAIAFWWIAALGATPLGHDLQHSTLVVDHDGRLLRPYTTPEGRWRFPATRADVDPRFLTLLIAYEDKRFFSHRGVDLLALGRSAIQLIRN